MRRPWRARSTRAAPGSRCTSSSVRRPNTARALRTSCSGSDPRRPRFSAALAGLSAGSTIHYRAVASSDFSSITGADQTLTTVAVPKPPKPAKPKVHIVSVHQIAKGHLLKVKIVLSKPAKVTIRVLSKKKVVRALTVSRKKAGLFTVVLLAQARPTAQVHATRHRQGRPGTAVAGRNANASRRALT